ncbi:ATP-dependent DNA helicase [Trichonephila clavipes]|uniref:ATP-dependent DNA helicase n=1 Tax=Trichonephila clavipes TaxID=2585209 RepID=A0A8X7BD33_TRICX|nr:ATP-dependent DNA helicase [Trichonephila clavipes]
MIPSDSTIPFKRLNCLAFAMSINKSQGQTMSICGLDLENPCFSHGQLYVACSRVGKPSNLFVLAKDRPFQVSEKIKIPESRAVKAAFHWVPSHCGLWGNEMADLLTVAYGEYKPPLQSQPQAISYKGIAKP